MAIGDHSIVREVLLVLALVLIGCRSAPPAAGLMEGGQPNADAIADEDGSPDRALDVETGLDAPVDARDAGIDADPFQCSTVTPLVLSDPMVISGTVAGGQTVTVQITMTDTDPSGYVSYPGVVLTSSTPGVSFAAAEAVILDAWGERITSDAEPARDAKTAVQEWAQSRALAPPR